MASTSPPADPPPPTAAPAAPKAPLPPFTTHPSLTPYLVPASTYLTTLSTQPDSNTPRPPIVTALATAALVMRPPPPTSSTTEPEPEPEPEPKPQPRILLLRRAPTDSMPLRWEPPGGAVDDDDATILHGCARELWEEAGLRAKRVCGVVVRKEGGMQVFPTRSGRVVGKVGFLVEVELGDGNGEGVRLSEEHVDWCWVTEEGCRRGLAGVDGGVGQGETGGKGREVEIEWTTEEQKRMVLEGFEVWRTLRTEG